MFRVLNSNLIVIFFFLIFIPLFWSRFPPLDLEFNPVEMEPVTSVLDSVKAFVKRSETFVKDAFQSLSPPHRHNPIEILKRLQQEAFSDLMKLRGRQDKVERILSSLKSEKGNPFQDATTHMKGIFNVGGSLFLHEDLQAYDILINSRMKSAVDARFIFKTNLRQKDAFVAELVASHGNTYNGNDFNGSPLVLSKVMHLASINDLFSVISIPYGATCNDFRSDSDYSQGGCATGLSLSRPPLFNKCHAFAAGLTVRASNFAASFAELVSGWGWGTQLDPAGRSPTLSTFGEISCQPFGEIKLTFSGVCQIPSSFSQPLSLGRLTKRVDTVGSHSKSDELDETSSSATRNQTAVGTGGSICMMVDIDESTKFGGWVEVQKLRPSSMRWAISLSDIPEYEVGWDLTVGGSVEGQLSSVLLEGFLNFSVDKRGSLQPGLALVINERGHALALMLRSSWSM